MIAPLKRFFQKSSDAKSTKNDSSKRAEFHAVTQSYFDNLILLYGSMDMDALAMNSSPQLPSLPLEQIYRPPQLIPLRSETSNTAACHESSLNSLLLLEPNSRIIVSGPLGSGKSILLRFLALATCSKSLRQRYEIEQRFDGLPILLSLNDYARQIEKSDISLLGYMQQIAQHELNVSQANSEFFDHYLTSGRALLLFDGLDEVRNPYQRKLIISRLLSFCTAYPNNRVIITIRTSDYAVAPMADYRIRNRFEPAGFKQYGIAKLNETEIGQFIERWAQIQGDNVELSTEQSQRLLTSLKDERYPALYPLAQNPLFLTLFVSLHHTRHFRSNNHYFFYQSCIETLVEGWPFWKYREEAPCHSRAQKRQMLARLSATAYWMHQSGIRYGQEPRAVVKHAALKKFVASTIQAEREPVPTDVIAEEFAEDFITLVEEQMALLSQHDSEHYRFSALAFQEYLAATFIRHVAEKSEENSTVERLWHGIKEHCADPQWHGVIRLLFAGFEQRAMSSQLLELLLAAQVESYPNETGDEASENRAILLGNLLGDGIEAARWKRKEILKALLYAGCFTASQKRLTQIQQIIRAWLREHQSDQAMMLTLFQEIVASMQCHEGMLSALLIGYALDGLIETEALHGFREQFLEDARDKELCQLFFAQPSAPQPFVTLQEPIEQLWHSQKALCLDSAYGALVATVFQALTQSLSPATSAKRAFEHQMVLLLPSLLTSPYPYLNVHNLYLGFNGKVASGTPSAIHVGRALERAFTLDQRLVQSQDRMAVLEAALQQVRQTDRRQAKSLAYQRAEPFVFTDSLAPSLALDELWQSGEVGQLWGAVLDCPALCEPMIDLLVNIFDLAPTIQWREALKSAFLPIVTDRLSSLNQPLFDKAEQQGIASAFVEESVDEIEYNHAARLLLFDAWLYLIGYYREDEPSICEDLALLTQNSDAIPLQVAHLIRGLAYGDESKAEILGKMVQSDQLGYRALFESCLWREAP